MTRWTCMLAAGATGTALCLSVLAGWQRGGSMAERLVWVALGIVLVTSAHLLPALVREAPVVLRAVGGVLWLACMTTACYGHATFYLLAQRHAGELRSAVVPVSPLCVSAAALRQSWGNAPRSRHDWRWPRLSTAPATAQRWKPDASRLPPRLMRWTPKPTTFGAGRRPMTGPWPDTTSLRLIQSQGDSQRYSVRPSRASIC